MRGGLSFLHGSFIEQQAEHNCFKMISATKLQKQVFWVDFLHLHQIIASEKQWFFTRLHAEKHCGLWHQSTRPSSKCVVHAVEG